MKALSFLQPSNKTQKSKADITIIQSKLRTLYEQIINLVKMKPKTKTQQAAIMQKLKAYESSYQIMEVSIQMILYLMKKQRQNIMQASGQIVSQGFITQGSLFTPMGTIYTAQQYKCLQQSLQKAQLRNRQLIKKEQITKLYCDQLQQKVKQSEKAGLQLQGSVKSILINLKKQNHQLLDQNHRLKLELIKFRQGSLNKIPNVYNQNNHETNINSLNKIIDDNIYTNQMDNSKKSSTKGNIKFLNAINKLDNIIKLDQNSNNSQVTNSLSKKLKNMYDLQNQQQSQRQSFLNKSLTKKGSLNLIKLSRGKVN